MLSLSNSTARTQAGNLRELIKLKFLHTLAVMARVGYLAEAAAVADFDNDMPTLQLLVEHCSEQKAWGHKGYAVETPVTNNSYSTILAYHFLRRGERDAEPVLNFKFVEQLLVLGANAHAPIANELATGLGATGPRSIFQLAWQRSLFPMVALMLAYNGLPPKPIDTTFNALFDSLRKRVLGESDLREAIRILLTQPRDLKPKHLIILNAITEADLTTVTSQPKLLHQLLVAVIARVQKNLANVTHPLELVSSAPLPLPILQLVLAYFTPTAFIGDDIAAVVETKALSAPVATSALVSPGLPILTLDEKCCQQICGALTATLGVHIRHAQIKDEKHPLKLLKQFLAAKKMNLSAKELAPILCQLLHNSAAEKSRVPADLSAELAEGIAEIILCQDRSQPMRAILSNPGTWFMTVYMVEAARKSGPAISQDESYNQELQRAILQDLLHQAVAVPAEVLTLPLAELLQFLNKPSEITRLVRSLPVAMPAPSEESVYLRAAPASMESGGSPAVMMSALNASGVSTFRPSSPAVAAELTAMDDSKRSTVTTFVTPATPAPPI